MSEEEMIEYLVSTGLYKDTKSDLFYEKRMINTNKTIPISELIERFISSLEEKVSLDVSKNPCVGFLSEQSSSILHLPSEYLLSTHLYSFPSVEKLLHRNQIL